MFNINGIEWRILLVSPSHPALIRSDNSVTLGSCDNNTNTIYINDSLSQIEMKKVLCHEITHAAMFSYNIDLSMDQEELLANLIATYGQEIIYFTNLIFKKIKNTGI